MQEVRDNPAKRQDIQVNRIRLVIRRGGSIFKMGKTWIPDKDIRE